jgi:hypothetical protein
VKRFYFFREAISDFFLELFPVVRYIPDEQNQLYIKSKAQFLKTAVVNNF